MWFAGYSHFERRQAPMSDAFDVSSGLDGLTSWMRRHAGLSEAAHWAEPTERWRVRRLEIVPFAGQCRVSMWNEDGDIRAVFDGRFDLTFDERDVRGWHRLFALLEDVAEGRIVISRRPLLFRWTATTAADPSRKAGRGRYFSAYTRHK